MICEVCGKVTDFCSAQTRVDVCLECEALFLQALKDAKSNGAWGRAREEKAVARRLLRRSKKTTKCILTDIPVEALKEFKSFAAFNGLSIRGIFLEALEGYLRRADKRMGH